MFQAAGRKNLAQFGSLICAMLLSACSIDGQSTTDLIVTEAAIPEATVAVAVQPAATPAPQTTAEVPQELNIWWPENLAPLDNETAAEILSEQLSAFQRENSSIVVDFRLKQVGDVGGILSTLRTAAVVAPGALPDITLLQRNDLLVAVQNNLIYPLDSTLFPAVLEDLPPIGVTLGSVNNGLYGLAYILTVQHVIYPASPATPLNGEFESLLANDLSFVFPAARPNGLNDVFLAQYLAAGGQWDDFSQNTINATALFDTLAFYEQASAAELVSPAVLEYTGFQSYQEQLANPTVPTIALIPSAYYLQMSNQRDNPLRFGVIPTRTGQPITVVDGWLWVLTTADAERQAQAIRFLNWILNAGRQGQYTRAIHMLPSQRTALRQMSDSEYAAFIGEILNYAVPTLTESESGTAARVIQSALEEVIDGTRSAEEATQDVLLQLES